MKIAFYIPLFLGLSACAKPKYENASSQPIQAIQIEKVADCKSRFQPSGHCLLWSWEKMPSPTEPGSLIFKIVRSNTLDDSPVPVEQSPVPELILWMPAMGHGSSPTTVEKVDTGSYRATNVFFVMPGQWELRFQIKDGNTIRDEAVVPVTI